MYVEPADLITRFGAQEISDVLGDPSQPPDERNERLVAACLDASAIADAYISRVAKLPLRYVPLAIVAAVADIARYRLHDDQVFEGGEQGKTTLRIRYEDAIKWFELVASGDIALFANGKAADEPDSPLPLRKGGRIAVVSSPVVFDHDTLGKMDAVRRH